jgi:hypothetical protein
VQYGSEKPKIPGIKPEIWGSEPAGLRFLAFRAPGAFLGFLLEDPKARKVQF